MVGPRRLRPLAAIAMALLGCSSGRPPPAEAEAPARDEVDRARLVFDWPEGIRIATTLENQLFEEGDGVRVEVRPRLLTGMLSSTRRGDALVVRSTASTPGQDDPAALAGEVPPDEIVLEMVVDGEGQLVTVGSDPEALLRADGGAMTLEEISDHVESRTRGRWDSLVGVWNGRTLRLREAEGAALDEGSTEILFAGRLPCPHRPSRPDASCVALRLRQSWEGVEELDPIARLVRSSLGATAVRPLAQRATRTVELVAEEQTLLPHRMLHDHRSASTWEQTAGGHTTVELHEHQAMDYRIVLDPEEIEAASRGADDEVVRLRFDALVAAAVAREGRTVASLATAGCLDELARARDLALEATAEELRAADLRSRLVALLLRAAAPAGGLRQMDGPALLAFLVDQGLYQPAGAMGVRDARVAVTGERASVLLGHHRDAPIEVAAAREEGRWQLDALFGLTQLVEALRRSARERSRPEDEVLVEYVGRATGTPLRDDLWSAPAPD